MRASQLQIATKDNSQKNIIKSKLYINATD